MNALTEKLPRVPASFFGIVLGLAGLGGTWRAAHIAWSLPAAVGEGLFVAAFVSWVLLVALYAFKWMVAPKEAMEEASHAVQCCFIGLAGVATLLIALGVLPYSHDAAIALFVIGATFTLLFALWRTGILWRGNRDHASTTPVLYLPMVAGGFVTSTVSSSLGWHGLSEMTFGAALFSWLAIESVLLHRFYTAPEMPPALRPTLGIQLAPPAVGAVAYLAIHEHSEMFANMLIGYALLQALLLLRMVRWIRQAPFAPSYWAFTFGTAAIAGATTRLSIEFPSPKLTVLAWVLFIGANLIIVMIAAGTIRLLFAGRLFPAAASAAGPYPTPRTSA